MAKNNTYETLKIVTSNFTKDLECPICMDVVQNPFKMCANGHLMCVGCLNTLKVCPTCQGDLLVESPVCIKNMLDHLPHHCQHTDNGCKEIVEKEDSHEKFCGFRQINCRRCKECVIAKALINHFNTIHADDCAIKFESEIREKSVYYHDFDLLKKYSFSNLVRLFNHYFWFTVNYCDEKELLEVIFEAVPIGKLENDYYVNVSFINGNFNFIFTLKACIPEESGQPDQDGNNRMSKDSISVPKALLPHFIEEDTLELSGLLFFKG